MTILALALALVGAVVTLHAAPGQQGTLAQSAPRGQTEPNALLEVYWKLVAVGDLKPEPQASSREPHIVFHPAGGVTGSDGCNTINGGYTQAGETLKLGPLMGTLMACPIPDRLDRRFREALVMTRSWKVTGGELTLLDENGTVVARFEPRVDR
jgi:copper homeostasis protein (lipoprotein)